jgi:hypothetical protein
MAGRLRFSVRVILTKLVVDSLLSTSVCILLPKEKEGRKRNSSQGDT